MTASFLRWALLAVMLVSANAGAFCIGSDEEFEEYSPDYYSVAKEFERALYVVEVRSLKETWLGEGGPKPLKPPFLNGSPRPLGLDPYVGAIYDVEVIKAFKGRPPKRFKLFSENSTARFHLWVGRRHLLFVRDEDSGILGRQLTVDNCGNSTEIGKAGKIRREVAKLAKGSTPQPGDRP